VILMHNWNIGVLNDKQLKELIKKKYITNFQLRRDPKGRIKGMDGSSLDLHLSDQAWEVTSTSKLPEDYTVEMLIKERKGKELSLAKENLKKEHIYIVRLEEELSFDKFPSRNGLYGVASGRSSIGRLDILTRLILDKSARYDVVPPAYKGPLFLEVVPLSFEIILRKGISLNQLRVFHGRPELSEFSSKELSDCAPMLYNSDGISSMPDPELLCVNLKPDSQMKKENIIAFSAKTNDPPNIVDLTKGKGYHNPREYFEGVVPNMGEEKLLMETNKFYILRSTERMFLPNDVAVTGVAYTENLGELRIHYAGFAHPNFGKPLKSDRSKPIGAPVIFETRCHSFRVTLHKHEHFAKIIYYKMSEPTDTPSSYSDQELTLSSYFKNWE
jgi:dCTP deaminase